MKKYALTLILALFALSTQITAVTAYPYPIRFTQPDKTQLTLTMKGDERIKWAETEDGYSLVYNNDGFFCYATKDENGDMVPSQYIATDIANRSAEVTAFLERTPKHLFYSESQTKMLIDIWFMANDKSLKSNEKMVTLGTVKFPVILASFSNKSFAKTKAQFNNLLNQAGYGTSGSVSDFYKENSYGKMQLEFVAIGPIRLPQTIAYYGNNSNGNSQQFARDAINLANDSVDFSQFDNDGDGYVDGVHIFFAGYGEESGGGADCIWSHRGTIASSVPTVDGKRLKDYSCSPELRGSSGSTITNIGVICHELGHVFGAPDFYDTDYESNGQYPGTGEWDIMGSGSWNNNGATPCHHNPYSKCYIYHWATPKILTQPEAVVLNNAEGNDNSFYRYETSTTGEYFLLENRQKQQFDANIPGSGLMIYRVHKNGVPGYNVNNTHPQKFCVVSATSNSAIPTSTASTYGSLNNANTPFGNTKFAFNDSTLPSSKAWNGLPTQKPLSQITKVSRNKTVCFLFRNASINVGEFEANASSATAIKLSWRLFNYQKVLLVYSANGVFGTPQGDVYNAGDNISGGGVVLYQGYANTYNHTGLSPQTLYKYKIFSLDNGNWTTGVEAQATTYANPLNLPYNENFDADTNYPNFWSAEYDNTNYQWIVANRDVTTYTAHSGDNYLLCSAPNANCSGDMATLLTAPVNTSGASQPKLSFFIRNQRRMSDLDVVTIKYRPLATGNWVVLATLTNTYSAWTQLTFELPAREFVQVAFEASCHYGRGIAIDDVRFYDEAAGINTASADNSSIAIYPNPATNKVNIAATSNQTISYEVFDLMGRSMVRGNVEAEQTAQLNTSNWKPGVYIIKIHSGNNEKTKQLIIK